MFLQCKVFVQLPHCVLLGYVLNNVFTDCPQPHEDNELLISLFGGSDRVRTWYIEYDVDVSLRPLFRVWCSDLYCGTVALPTHPNWASGVDVTVSFEQHAVVVFHDQQLVGRCAWVGHDRYQTLSAPFFFIMITRRTFRPVSRMARKARVFPLSTVVDGALGRAQFVQALLSRPPSAPASARAVAGGVSISRPSS